MFASAKRTIKYFTAVFLYYTGSIALLSYLKRIFSGCGNFAILMYHRVLDEDDREREYSQPGMYVSARVFEKQIAFLSRKYKIIRLRELTDLITRRQNIPSNSLVITFDDGWRDNYLCAFPVLKKYKVPAAVFLTTDYIDSDKMFWFYKASILTAGNKLSRRELGELIAGHESLKDSAGVMSNKETDEANNASSDGDWFIDRLKKLEPGKIDGILERLSAVNMQADDIIKEGNSMLSWDEVREMNRERIDFGSHGCSHRIMPGLSDAEITDELTESKGVIEEKLGGAVDLFAYPNGDYNDRIKELAENCGYICALATGGKKKPQGNTDLFSLRRINVHDGVSVGPGGRFSRAMFSLHILRSS